MNTSSGISAAAATATARPVAPVATAPRFEIDPSWPKPLPEGWIAGQLACVYVDHNDHVLVVNRGDITEEEKETCIRAPAVMIFDLEGNLIGSWGDWDVLPSHAAQLRRRSRQQHLDHRERRRHGAEVHLRRQAAASRSARRACSTRTTARREASI